MWLSFRMWTVSNGKDTITKKAILGAKDNGQSDKRYQHLNCTDCNFGRDGRDARETIETMLKVKRMRSEKKQAT